MATTTDVIRRITIQGSSAGVDEATAALNKLAVAQGNVAVVSDASAKRLLSAEAAYKKQTMAVDDHARSQAQVAKATKVADDALRQGLITQDDHVKRVSLINQKYGEAGAAARAYAQATQAVNSQISMLSGGAGQLGSILSAIGPAGIAAAVGIGATVLAISAMVSASHDLAQKSQELRAFSEATGLSTAQVQALRSEASRFGVTSEEAQTAIQHFTASFNELRVGQGALLTQVRRVNPALADQMAGATDAATAMTLFGKALQQTDNIFERNALVKAAAGRGGLRTAAFLSGLDVDAVTQSYVNAGKALDDNLIKKLAQLEIDIAKTSSKARDNVASIFAQPVLEAQLYFVRNFLTFSEYAKNFTLSDGLKTYLSIVGKGVLSAIPGAGLLAAGVKAATTNYSSGAKLPDIDPFGDFSVGGAYAKPQGGKSPLFDLETLKKQISAMGEAAPAAMKLKAAMDELKLSEGGQTLSATQLASAQDVLLKSFDAQRISAANSAMGSATTVAEQLQEKIAKLNLELAKGNINAEQFFRGMAGVAADEAIRKQSDMVSALGDLATPMDQYKLRVMQLQQQLDQGRISQDTFNRALIAANPIFKELSSGLQTFGSTLNSTLAQGKSGAEALSAALGAVGSKVSGDLMTGGINKALSGIMSGNGADIATGGVGIAASVAISMLQGDAARRKKEQADFEAAQKAWSDMAADVAKFTAQMSGSIDGPLTSSLADATKKAQDFADAAHKAGQSSDDLERSLQTFTERMVHDFTSSFDTIIGALNDGLGFDSPAVKGAQRIKDIGDQLKGFITDTQKVNSLISPSATSIFGRTEFGDKLSAQLGAAANDNGSNAAAVAAAQNYAKSLLQTPPVLSDVATKMLTLYGGARQLATTLQDLGVSAEDAGRAISDGIAQALDTIKADFVQGLQARLNTAQGKDYLNSINGLITQGASDLGDANLLGIDPRLVAQTFAAEAQQIVDSAGLVGDSFDALIKVFPQLSGVVHESTSAIQQQIAYYQQLKTSIAGYLSGLLTGSSSTLAPADKLAAAQSRYSSQLTLARGGNSDALNSITQTADTLLAAGKDFYASGQGYADLFKMVQSTLGALPDQAAANDPLLKAVNQVGDNTGAALDLLSAVRGLNSTVSDSILKLGQQDANLGTAQGSTFFGPMTGYLKQIEENTRLSGQAATPPDTGAVWWNPFTWFHDGGVVGRYAPGGIVGNGMFNVDSVRARYAGGGDIMLAGNEFVTRATSVNSSTLPWLDAINRNGTPPANDNTTRAIGDSSRAISRAVAGAAMAHIAVLQEEMGQLRSSIARLGSDLKATPALHRPSVKRATS